MKIAVIPNNTKDINLQRTRQLCKILKENNIIIQMDSEYINSGIDAVYTNDIYDGVSCAVVLGGDGTIIRAAVACSTKDIPILGINLGRIGFMTETEIDDVEENIKRFINGDYNIEERMMMKVTIHNHENSKEYLALNDVVVSKPDAQMVNVGVFADGEEITEYIADGVIISTPTGSTAYSLSAGGPVADPSCEIFLATPICAHKLSNRPVVLNPWKKICVKLFEGNNKLADVTIDGIVISKLKVNDTVSVVKAEVKLKLISFGKRSFYETMTAKLS